MIFLLRQGHRGLLRNSRTSCIVEGRGRKLKSVLYRLWGFCLSAKMFRLQSQDTAYGDTLLLLMLLLNLRLLWTTNKLFIYFYIFFFALFILDKLIKVSELVMAAVSFGRPRVNDKINLHSFPLFPSPPHHTQSCSLLPVWLCLKTHIISLFSSCQDNYSLLSEELEVSSDCRATLSLTSVPWRATLTQHGANRKDFNPRLFTFCTEFKLGPQPNPLIISFFSEDR